jgi:hypothetical protein
LLVPWLCRLQPLPPGRELLRCDFRPDQQAVAGVLYQVEALRGAQAAISAGRLVVAVRIGERILLPRQQRHPVACGVGQHFRSGEARQIDVAGEVVGELAHRDVVAAPKRDALKLGRHAAAVDRFQTDDSVRVAVCNLVAGGVGLNLTAATHVIFQDLDWVPANHLQAEDRAYRLGQRERVTVEYMLAHGTLDVYIADLLETKLRLISAVETDEPLDSSMLEDLYNRLRALGPAPLQENRIASGSAAVLERLEKLAAATPRAMESPLLSGGVHEFRSSRDPKSVYRVTFGRAGHLECTCEGFRWRGNCKHVRKVRQAAE